jgi:hypothetical protein
MSICRFCQAKLNQTLVNLGMSPLCESYLASEQLNSMEPFYPLHVYVCEECFLVQLDEFVSPEDIFSEYAYFSSYSDSWLKHAEDYVEMITKRLSLNEESHVVEIASNDGYLLQYFLDKRIPILGIEPALNVAEVAIKKGIPTITEFFGENSAIDLVKKEKQADLLIGNNVLAQVPDINDFVMGMKILLSKKGVITMEFPHLIRLMEENQFDTIYHEHFSYFSLYSVERIFSAHGLKIFDVDQISTHGGSLRIYACHHDNRELNASLGIEELREQESQFGINNISFYKTFEGQVKETKRKLLEFLIDIKRQGKTVAGYGAPGKGNTLLNYCGIREDFLDYTVDRNPYKQGKYLPGTHIPIFSPDRIRETKPDYLMILPWNFKDEIMEQNSFIKEWGGQFFVPIPEVKVHK